MHVKKRSSMVHFILKEEQNFPAVANIDWLRLGTVWREGV